MKKLFVLSTLMISVCFSTLVFSQEKIPTVVIFAHSSGDIEEYIRYVRTFKSDHKIVPILLFDKATSTELRRISESVEISTRDSLITDIMIISHGRTEFGDKTKIIGLGSFSKDQIGIGVARVFQPMIGRVSESLNIAFFACATFCSTDDKSAQKAQKLLDIFNIKNGSVVGARGILSRESMHQLMKMQELQEQELLKIENESSQESIRHVIDMAVTNSLIAFGLVNLFVSGHEYVQLALAPLFSFVQIYFGRELYFSIKALMQKNKIRIFDFGNGKIKNIKKTSIYDYFVDLRAQNSVCVRFFR